MDDYSSQWNPKHNPGFKEEYQSSVGPINPQIWYPPPSLQQNFQTPPESYYFYSCTSYPPPPLPPASGPQLATFSPLPLPQLGASLFCPLSTSVCNDTAYCESDKEWLRNWLSQSRVQPVLKNSSVSHSAKVWSNFCDLSFFTASLAGVLKQSVEMW